MTDQQANTEIKNEWKSVVAPLPEEGQYEERVKYYMNKLRYKMPVTFRYGLVFAFCSGIIGVGRHRSPWRLPAHLMITTPIFGIGLCYQELFAIGENYYKAYYQGK